MGNTWLRVDDSIALNPEQISAVTADTDTFTLSFWNYLGDTELATKVCSDLNEMTTWAKVRFSILVNTWVKVDTTTAVNLMWVSKMDIGDAVSKTVQFWRQDGTEVLAQKTFDTRAEMINWVRARIIYFTHENVPFPEPE